MRRAISISLVCLLLGWARPAAAGPPAESAPAEPASEPEELPPYDAPIVVEEPAETKPSVDGEIPVMIAIGSVLLGGGIIGGVLLLGAGLYVAYYGWYELRVLDGAAADDPVVRTFTEVQGAVAGFLNDLGTLPIAAAFAALLLLALALRTAKRRRSRREPAERT